MFTCPGRFPADRPSDLWLWRVCWKPLGDYMARIFTTDRHWGRGTPPVQGDEAWTRPPTSSGATYLRSMLAFSSGQRAAAVRADAPCSTTCSRPRG